MKPNEISNGSLNENSQKKPNNPYEGTFELKIKEILQRLSNISSTASEIKPEVVSRTDTRTIYLKLCEILQIQVNLIFCSNLDNEKIDLSYQCLGPVGMTAVAKSLFSSPTVNEINFSFNNLGPTCLSIITLLLDHNEHINKLNLSNNEFGNSCAKKIGSMISVCFSISSLDLSYNDLGDAELLEITSAMATIDCIKDVNLRGNNFTSEGGKTSFASLGKCLALETLDLSRNFLEDGVMGIFKCLKKSNLKTLQLARNGIGDLAMPALSAGLKGNKSLQEVDLSYNDISDKGAAAMAPGIKKSTTLETLKLAYNTFQGDSANSILKSAINIKLLDLTGIRVNSGFLKTLRKTSESNNVEVLYGAEIRQVLMVGCSVPETEPVTKINAVKVVQQVADQKGVSLRKILRKIHAEFLNKENEIEGESKGKDDPKEERKMTMADFARALGEELGSKAIAREVAEVISTDGKVDMFKLIEDIPWRPDELVTKVKREKKPSPKAKKKGKKK